MPNELNSLDLVKMIEAEIVESRRLTSMPLAIDSGSVSDFIKGWGSLIHDMDISSSYAYCQNLSVRRTVKLSKKHVRRSKRRAKSRKTRTYPATTSVQYAFLKNVYPVNVDIVESNKNTGIVTLEATFEHAPFTKPE